MSDKRAAVAPVAAAKPTPARNAEATAPLLLAPGVQPSETAANAQSSKPRPRHETAVAFDLTAQPRVLFQARAPPLA